MTLSTWNGSRPEKQDQHRETRWRGAKGIRPESGPPLGLTERSGGDWKPTSMYRSSLLGDYNQLCHRHQQRETHRIQKSGGTRPPWPYQILCVYLPYYSKETVFSRSSSKSILIRVNLFWVNKKYHFVEKFAETSNLLLQHLWTLQLTKITSAASSNVRIFIVRRTRKGSNQGGESTASVPSWTPLWQIKNDEVSTRVPDQWRRHDVLH